MQSNIYVAVVDDDVSICRAMVRLLGASGIHAISYASAEKFLHDHKRPAFDCLLLDIQLAELSGVDLQEHLANVGGCPPIIFITANDDPRMRDRAESLGCAGYLRKTASGHELLQMIRSVISRRGNHE